jgi:hypothetical protein
MCAAKGETGKKRKSRESEGKREEGNQVESQRKRKSPK